MTHYQPLRSHNPEPANADLPLARDGKSWHSLDPAAVALMAIAAFVVAVSMARVFRGAM